jgi:hypothetical protein
MVSTVEDLDVRALLFLAQCDENTGPPAQRIRVISARAELAERRIPVPRENRDSMIGPAARSAMTLEHAAPEVSVRDRCVLAGYDPDADDKDEGQHVLDNPPQRP